MQQRAQPLCSPRPALRPLTAHRGLHGMNLQAGYATTYNVTGAPYDFSFVTVRLAGHMVPTFQPASAYTFFSRFMAKTPF